MKKNLLRTLSIVLALIMMLGLFVGCASDGAAGGSTGKKKGDKLEILYAGYTNGFTPAADTPVEKYIEEYFDGEVAIDLAQVDIGNADARNLYLAEGNIPDFFFAYWDRTYLKEQGLVQKLDWDEMWTYMPDYMATMAALFGGEEGLKTLMTDADGDIVYVPWSRFDYASTEGMNFRKDWLENLGLEVPETPEEVAEVWRAFTFDDPDGNGVDDTYGYNLNTYGWGAMWGVVGHTQWGWYVEDGTVKFSGVEDSYKEGLKFLASLYQEGVIDPESFSDDRAAMWDKWGNSKLGSMTLDPWMINNNQQTKTMLEAAGASYDDMMVYVPALKDDAGEYLPVKGYVPIGFQMMVGINATDAERQFIYKMLNTIVADPDFGWTLQYGIKGEGWDYNEDGTIKELITDQQAKRDMGAYIFGIMPADVSMLPSMISEPYVLDAFEKCFSVPFFTSGKDFNLYPFNSEAWQEKSADIDVVNDEYYIAALNGEIDIDATWDAHVAELNELGVAQILSEFQAAYDAANK